MRALSSRPFCPCGGRRVSLRYLSAVGRDTACDHLYPRMRVQPLGKRVGRAIWEEIHRLTALRINEHGAIGVAFP